MSSKSLLTVLRNGVKRVLSSSLHASQSKKGSFYFIFNGNSSNIRKSEQTWSLRIFKSALVECSRGRCAVMVILKRCNNLSLNQSKKVHLWGKYKRIEMS